MNGSVDPYLRKPNIESPTSYSASFRGETNVHGIKNLRLADGDCSVGRNATTMQAFPKPGGSSMIVLYEKDGYFTHVPSNSLEASRNPYLADHPEIFMSKEALKGSSKDSFQSVFLVQQDSTLKNIVVAWREGGFVNLLEEVLRASETRKLPAPFLKAIHCTLSVLQWSKNIYQSLSPHKMLPIDVMISTFSSTRHWATSPIRCIAWHPQNKKVAVGFSDDSVRIYGLQFVVPMLKNRRQKNVGAIAWRYNTSCDIAIGCQGCVLLWRLDPNTVAAKPSSSFLTVINHPNSTGPIVSLSWNSKSDWLAFGTCTDSALVLWDIHTEKQISVPNATSGGVTQVVWSRDGLRLVCTSPLIPFKVFTFEPAISTTKLGAEAGRVHTITWTPCGQHLIFADSENPRLYGLSLQVAEGGIRKLVPQPFVLADTTEYMTQCQNGDEVSVGGLIQSVACDARGERVAVLFKETQSLAIYSLKTKPTLQVEPLGLICGNDQEHPVSACFQPSFENGSLLSVAWSTGTVQHIPMFRSADSDTYGRSSLSSSFQLYGDSVLSPKLYSMQG